VYDLEAAAPEALESGLEIHLREPRGILAAWVVARVSGAGPFDLHAADK
jgi:hypothetical protein